MVLKDPVKTNQVAVQVIDDLIFAGLLPKKHPGGACEHLAIGFVFGHHRNNGFGQFGFSTDVS
jgi:hypothetical protein